MKKFFVLSIALMFMVGILGACTKPAMSEFQDEAKEDADEALSMYLENLLESNDAVVRDKIIFVVEKRGEWYSFLWSMGKLEYLEATNIMPEAPDGFTLEENALHLEDIPENISIYTKK